MPAPHATADPPRRRRSPFARPAAWVYACYAWLVFLILFPLAGCLIVLARRRSLCLHIAHRCSRLMFRCAGIRLEAAGLSALPASPHVLVVNHASFLDGLALSALLPPAPGYSFVVRQQYRSQLLFWPVLAPLGTVVLRPHHGADTNLGRLRTALRDGRRLIIFPEGRIRPLPGLDAFHSGAFVAAGEEHLPVVVAGLRGTRSALALGRWMPRRARIMLEIGPVFFPTGKNAGELVQRAREAMLGLAEQTGIDSGEQSSINAP